MTTRSSDYALNDATFRVTYGDLARVTADALVSSDDNYLSMSGGVSAALLRRGGDIIAAEARKHIPLKIGDVVVTSAGKLSAKYIFHACTIDFTHMIHADAESIRNATLKCLQLADTLNVRRLAFPALGTGVARFPFQLAAETMTRTIADYLFGNTRLELVTLTLFAREHTSESDLDLFYERSVALAAASTQSKRLTTLFAELAGLVGAMNKPDLLKRVVELQADLEHSHDALTKHPESLQQIEQMNEWCGLENVTKRAIVVSSDAQVAAWKDEQLEAEVLRTKVTGLLTQLNIQTGNLNRFEIEKAKYGGQLVPPRLENAIDEVNQEIANTQLQWQEARKRLAQLATP